MSRRLRNYLACAITVIAVAAAIIWFFRGQLLKGIADVWIVYDPLSRADAIVVLGGGMQTRPFEAARLYRDGYASQVLVASPEPRPTDQMELTLNDTVITKRILSMQGVPHSAVAEFGNGVSSTYEEAVALRDWVRKSGASRNGGEPSRVSLSSRMSSLSTPTTDFDTEGEQLRAGIS